MNTKEKDPVCGMEVDPATAESSELEGQTYYFCSSRCKNSFEEEPEKYLGEVDEPAQP